MRAFGFASAAVAAGDFLVPGRVILHDVEPYRNDPLTSISGVEFEDAWSDCVAGERDGVAVAFLSVCAFRQNRLAAGRQVYNR